MLPVEASSLFKMVAIDRTAVLPNSDYSSRFATIFNIGIYRYHTEDDSKDSDFSSVLQMIRNVAQAYSASWKRFWLAPIARRKRLAA